MSRTRSQPRSGRRSAVALLLAALPALLAAAPAFALGTSGARPAVRPGGGLRRGSDGQKVQLGFHLTPLFGYESNYRMTDAGAAGSPVWMLDGGASLRYRPSERLVLRTELSAMVRQMTAEPELVDFSVGLLAQLRYGLGSALELVLLNDFGADRQRTAPVLFDTRAAGAASGASSTGTIRYDTIGDTLRPALLWHILPSLAAELGPYARIKQVNFLENPYGGEPDYRLYDVGGDLSLSWAWREAIAVRLSYDFGRRWFSNYPARPPQHEPALAESLQMLRHVTGVRLASRPVSFLELFASYHLRLARTNGGFLDYNEHLVGGGLELQLGERVAVSSSARYLIRDYTDRTPCEAQQSTPGGSYGPGDCSAPGSFRQVQRERGLLVTAGVDVMVLEWLQVSVRYELEDADSDQQDPMRADHRALGGLTVSR